MQTQFVYWMKYETDIGAGITVALIIKVINYLLILIK